MPNRNKSKQIAAKCEQIIVLTKIIADLARSGDDVLEEVSCANVLLAGLATDIHGLAHD